MNFLCLIGLHKWRPFLLVIRPRSKYEKEVYRIHNDRCIRPECGLDKEYVIGREGIPPPNHSIFKESREFMRKMSTCAKNATSLKAQTQMPLGVT